MRTILISLALASAFALTSVSSLAHDKHSHDDEAIGKPGVATATTRSVEVNMSDAMRFTPSSFNAKQGETIRFVIKNSGSLKHEFILGTEKELKAHYELMKKNPEMEHSEPNMITLAGGQTGEVIWQFTKAGKIDFACLQPGHYDAGMKGKVMVVKGKFIEAAHHTPATSTVAATPDSEVDMVDGEVRKIDKESGKITLKHGAIKNLDMPGMTMVFKAKDPAELDKLQAGDKVRFKAEKTNGAIYVSDINLVK
jgi:uncharacterized cupredoxin-like copper-binding protein/Cu/Ag efflux protein CusF